MDSTARAPALARAAMPAGKSGPPLEGSNLPERRGAPIASCPHRPTTTKALRKRKRGSGLLYKVKVARENGCILRSPALRYRRVDFGQMPTRDGSRGGLAVFPWPLKASRFRIGRHPRVVDQTKIRALMPMDLPGGLHSCSFLAPGFSGLMDIRPDPEQEQEEDAAR